MSRTSSIGQHSLVAGALAAVILCLGPACTPTGGGGGGAPADTDDTNGNDNANANEATPPVNDNENDNGETVPDGGDGETTPPEGTPIEGLPIPLSVAAPAGAAELMPVTVGVPLATATASEPLTVVGPDGPVPTQTRNAVRLGDDNGLTWLLVDFQAQPGAAYTLDEGTPPEATPAVEVTTEADGGVIVDTGAGRWEVPASSDLLAAVTDGEGAELIRSAGWGETTAAEVEVVDVGPLRAMVRVTAREAVSGLDLVGRLHFYAGRPYARVRITLVNHSRCPTGEEVPRSDNGACGLADTQPACNGVLSANQVQAEDLTWALELADPPTGEEVIYQDSSGTWNWDYYADLEPRMQSGVTFRGFRHTRDGEVVAEGDAAEGTLSAAGVRLDVPWFRELFPKALRARAGRLEFGVLPEEFAEPHRLRAGEQKTHDVFVCLDPEVTPPWPVYAAPAFGYLRATHALGYIGPRIEGEFGAYEAYLDNQFDDEAHTTDDCNNDLSQCAASIPDARELWDYYGWTDFGDVPTDFENPRSPFNPKYDMNLGFLHQALRTGEVRWWELAHAMNVHFADIDILHARVRGYETDRIWFEGGSFGHTYHNEEGLTNPHRNCGNPAPDMYYGGAGAVAWALLTGDDMVGEAAVEVADNALWRALNAADTECARTAWGGGSGEGFVVWEDTQPPARPVANTQRLLTWAFRLTGDSAYLDGAAGAARWYDCEQGEFSCGNWPEALLARSMGEYITAARDAGLSVDPTAESGLEDLLELLADNTVREGDRAWLMHCTEDYAEINAWMFLAADAFSYGHAIGDEHTWLEDYARPLFNTAQQDPYYEGDTSQYHTSKELTNAVSAGTVFLHFARDGEP